MASSTIDLIEQFEWWNESFEKDERFNRNIIDLNAHSDNTRRCIRLLRGFRKKLNSLGSNLASLITIVAVVVGTASPGRTWRKRLLD